MPKQNASQVSFGFGAQSVAGTAVAPSIFTRQTSAKFERTTNRIENNSAMGRLEEINDSAVTSSYAAGPFEGKVYDQSIGYPLLSIFGSCATTTNADGSGNVKNHTFTVNSATTPPPLTFVKKDLNTNRRYVDGLFGSLEISAKSDDWVMANGDMHSQVGDDGSDVVAYINENPFTSKHTTVKLAANLAGLSGATAIDASNFSIKPEWTAVKPYVPLHASAPTHFQRGRWRCTGQFTLKYDATTYEDFQFANTIRAMSLTLSNTDVTIGTSARPSLTFTMPQVRLTTVDKSDDLEEDTEQTVNFTAELGATDGYTCQAVLTNLRTGYTT